MKLATILVVSFILVGVIGTTGGMYSYYFTSSDLLEDRISRDLSSASELISNLMEELLEEQVEKLNVIAIHEDLSSEELNKIVELQDEFSEVFVLDINGIITIASDSSIIGRDMSEESYFINAVLDGYTELSYLSYGDAITFSIPHNDDVLVARMNFDIFDGILLDRSSLGDTGEILMVYRDRDGGVSSFAERRFESEAVDDGITGVLLYEEALSKRDRVIFGVSDYRDVEVFAAVKYIRGLDSSLIVKIDEKEAFGAGRSQLIRNAFIIAVFVIVFVSLFGWFISHLISKPLRRLTEDVDLITKGKLDIQLEKSGIYEVQQFVDSLNRILASLKLAILRMGASGSKLGLGEESCAVKTPIVKKVAKAPVVKKVVKTPVVKKVVKAPVANVSKNVKGGEVKSS